MSELKKYSETFSTALSALQQNTPFNESELKSVQALIAYVAYTQTIGKAAVESFVLTAFSADSISAIPQDYYDDVIRLLVDMDFEATIN